MTENKRFTLENDIEMKDNWNINKRCYHFGNGFDAKDCCNMLNELQKENKQLKRENDILIKQRLGEERLKQEIANYHTSNGRLHRLNNELIRRLDEFHIDYSDILREFE